MNHGEKLGKFIFLERGLDMNPQNQKSLNRNQDSQRNHQVNKREIFKAENHKKIEIKIKIN